jgi:hypothetical protein
LADASNDLSRVARVLDPAFVADLESLSLDEIRSRRDEVVAEREFLSYFRRLVQVRSDLLAAERERRRAGREPDPLVDRLTEVLAEGLRGGTSRGEALRTALSEEDIAEAERRANSILGAIALASPEGLSDEDIERALQMLEREERGISADRAAVFQVHDRLQDELTRRYRDDPSSIPREP